MDTLTHAFTGAVIARAIGDASLGRWGTLAGLSAGVFPDVDFIFGLIDSQIALQYHRDFTHSFFLIPFYALFLSWVFVNISKRPYLWRYYKICLPSLLSHVLLDLLTSYGTMILSPISNRRFAWDLVFIIDLHFSGMVSIPLLASLFFKKASTWVCRGSLVGLTAYVLFCGLQHAEALSEAKSFSRALEARVVQIAALPQPLSPFRWALLVETEERVYQGFVNLKKGRWSSPSSTKPPSTLFERLDRLYDPPKAISFQAREKLPDSLWVKRALRAEGVPIYYWFARFPVVKSIGSNDGRHRVEFMDMRFFLPGIRLPFVYYVEMDESGRILSEGFLKERRAL